MARLIAPQAGSPLIAIPTAPSGAIVLEAGTVGAMANLDSSCALRRQRSHGRDEKTDFQIEQRN
jgi:hypothetical protein